MANLKKIAVIGNGSFATALVKVLSDGKHPINWWMRNTEALQHIKKFKHNPHYLSQVYFKNRNLKLTNDIVEAVSNSDIILLAVPSAFVVNVLQGLGKAVVKNKIFISAIKGIVPNYNVLINEYLATEFGIPEKNYVCITGPCHAEEVAAEKLSYLTFSSANLPQAKNIAKYFETNYLKTIITQDVYGVQFAAILKNIYALGTGIAHGLDYGDNFLSVYNTNCFAEMKFFMQHIAKHKKQLNTPHHYITSAYLGDLLVTSYSLHSRNRSFGNMLGKGYSVANAKLELNMVAEGYYAAQCIFEINKQVKAPMPILNLLYGVLWQGKNAKQNFKLIEKILQ
jgi:glycerol-3-phosphate dehydrogenase (NAD(P)+)